ncbi:MAG TPA: hypothetical protein VKX45_03410 [Bryobacteraceae bacterium]|jgi:hypothetical protein|nr:hypothetical protein [Bryobacteraceae bacterium]
MDVEAIFDRLMEAGVSVWLDSDGKLRIDKGAPEEIKHLVRDHKQAIIDVKKAIAIMNARGIRIIRLPLGHHAMAYPLGTDIEEIRWAMKVLGQESMPLVLNDEGLRWMTWNEWKLRPEVWRRKNREDPRAQPAAEVQPKLQFGRKTA